MRGFVCVGVLCPLQQNWPRQVASMQEDLRVVQTKLAKAKAGRDKSTTIIATKHDVMMK